MPLVVTPTTPTIGAMVSGIDLREPLDPSTVGEVRAALLLHLVLFFRDQDISTEQQQSFAEHFGPVMVSPEGSAPQWATTLDNASPRDDRWHADGTQMSEPPLGAVLRAVQLPQCGGDTCFSSMYAAYDALSSPFRALLDGLTAVHFNRYREVSYVHPVVRVHPETGRRLLNVNRSKTIRIVELEEDESDAVLAFLFSHIKAPVFQCRFRWEPNSIAFWDNRAVQHSAVSDYSDRRVMHRVQISGDHPFGPMSVDEKRERVSAS